MAAGVLGRSVRARELTTEAALEALGEVRAEVGVVNMTDDEVVPLPPVPSPKL